MSLKFYPIIKIVNSNYQKIFKYPNNTLLDNILPDIWPIIIDYYQHDKTFMIGSDKKYSGYKKIKWLRYTNDFKTFFSDYYKNNEGLYCLEKLNNGDHRCAVNWYYETWNYGQYYEGKIKNNKFVVLDKKFGDSATEYIFVKKDIAKLYLKKL